MSFVFLFTVFYYLEIGLHQDQSIYAIFDFHFSTPNSVLCHFNIFLNYFHFSGFLLHYDFFLNISIFTFFLFFRFMQIYSVLLILFFGFLSSFSMTSCIGSILARLTYSFPHDCNFGSSPFEFPFYN